MKRNTLLTAFLALTVLSGTLAGSGSASAHGNNDRRHHKDWDHDRYDPYERYDRDNNWNRGRGYSYDYNDRYSSYPIVRISIDPWDREKVRREMDREYWEKCRTVAGQRYNNCKGYNGHGVSYRSGERLPPHAVAWNVPRNVVSYLPRATHGTRYIWVDRDILLITSDGGIVLDSIRVR